MQAGFDRGLQLVDNFVTKAQDALAKQPRSAGGQYAAYGVDSANAFVTSMTQALEAKKSVLIEAYARGILNPAEFAQLGTQATQAFNKNLLQGLDAIDLKKAVPPEARQAIVDALRETGVAAADAFDPTEHIGGKLRSLGRDFTQVGEELSIALTVPLALGAHAALEAADTIEKAFDKIRISTGATGTQLSGLNDTFTTLFKTLPVSAGDLATALTIISTISGATGKNLADLTTQAVNLARITGTDLKSNVEASQHAFQAWGTTVADQAGHLDILFKVSQQSGSTVADLSSTLTRFAPAMRDFGLNFTQSAALIGQFQKSGLDADRIFTSLQTSLARFAQNGVSGAQAFQLIIDKIKSASTLAQATDLASQVFGPRQAAALASAIRDGKLNIEGLTASIRASGETINGAAKDFEPYKAAVQSLHNETTLAAGVIGTQLEEAFIRIEPALETAAKAVSAAATAFSELPQPVKDAAIGFLTLLAVLGPGVLIFGGIVKAIGAFSLAIELLRGGIVRLAFGGVAAEATEFAASATEASGAVSLLAGGLSALTGTAIVVGVIAAIYAAFEHFTKAATEAKDALADFTANVTVLNGKQLNIQTTTLRAQLVDVNEQIKTLSATIDGEVSGHKILGIGVLSGQEDQLAKLQTSAGLLSDKLDAVGSAQERLRTKSGASTVELTKFNAAVDALITGAGKGITIDPTGAVSGSISALKKDLAALQDQQRIAIRLGKPDTKEFEQAIENVQTGLTKAQTAGLDFPDKLSLGVKNLGKVVEEMVARTKQLGDGFRQISDIKLDTAIANQIDDLDKKLKSLGDSTTLDAKALRGYYDALRATLAGQLAQPGTAFKFHIDGTLDRIVVPTKVGAELFDFLKTGLQVIEDQATKAAAASQRLAEITAGGFGAAALEDATNVQSREYAKLFDLQNQLQRAFKATGTSGAAFDAVLKEIGKTITERGANASLVKQFSISQADVAAIAADIQKSLAPLGVSLGVKVKIEPFISLGALEDLGQAIGNSIQKGQVNALSGGNSGYAAAASNAALDQATLAAEKFASANKGLLSTEDIFKAISAFAKDAGTSVGALITNMQKLSTLGKLISIAGVFTTISTEIFGANSALAKFGTTVGQTLNGLQALSKANAEIAADQAGGGSASFTSIIDKIGAIGSIVGTAVGLLGSLFGKSQLDIEHDKILASNNDALAALKDSIDREAGTAARAGDLIKAISAANKDVNSLASGSGVADSTFKDAVGQFLSSNGPLSFPGAVQSGVGAVLKQFGLTIDQADAAAKALGITLQDSKGNFVGLDAFMKALALDAVKLTTLGNDLATNQSLISVRNALNNTAATPAQALKDSVDAIVKTVGPNSGLAQQLQSAFNAGPAALRAALSKIVDEIQAGTLSLQDLGGLTDVSSLLSAIGGTASALNALSTTATAATTALLNVPAGFKKALTEFNAQNPQAGAPGSTPAVPPTLHPDPVPPDTTILASLATLLTGLTKTPAGTSSNPIAGSQAAPDALTGLAAVLAKLTQAGTTSGTALSDVLAQLSSKLPTATESAS
ncbi:MAG: phage tail tape measure protein, partial [Casimicrobiaceae bacterium]